MQQVLRAPRFWDPAVLCVKKCVLYYMQGWILEFRCPRRTLEKRALYFTHATHKLYPLKEVKFSILSGNLLLRESTFYTINCLKSFDFKLIFVYTFKLLRAPFGTLAHNLCFILKNTPIASVLIKRGTRVINKRFNKTMQKLCAKLSKRGPSRHLWKTGCEATASFASPNIHPWLFLLQMREMKCAFI